MDMSSVPAEVLAFFRYLGVDPRKPDELYSMMEVLGKDTADLYRIWHRFCGHLPISPDTTLDLIKQINVPTAVTGRTVKTEKIPKNFSKTP